MGALSSCFTGVVHAYHTLLSLLSHLRQNLILFIPRYPAPLSFVSAGGSTTSYALVIANYHDHCFFGVASLNNKIRQRIQMIAACVLRSSLPTKVKKIASNLERIDE